MKILTPKGKEVEVQVVDSDITFTYYNQPVVLGAEFGWTSYGPKISKAYGSPLWKVMNGEEHEQEDSLSERRCSGQAEREDTTTQESCKKVTERGKNTST